MSVIGHGTEICTSTTRPSTAAQGAIIFETDTNKALTNKSTTSTPSWVEITDLDNAYGLSENSYNIFKNTVTNSTSTNVSITSATFSDSGITATITPSSSSSKILVLISAQAGVNRLSNIAAAYFKVVRNSTDILTDGTTGRRLRINAGLGASSQVQSNSTNTLVILDSPATTSAVTYKLQGATESGLATLQFQVDGATTSTIVLSEVMS